MVPRPSLSRVTARACSCPAEHARILATPLKSGATTTSSTSGARLAPQEKVNIIKASRQILKGICTAKSYHQNCSVGCPTQSLVYLYSNPARPLDRAPDSDPDSREK